MFKIYLIGLSFCLTMFSSTGIVAKIKVTQKLYETSGIHEQVKGLPEILFSQVQNEFEYADLKNEINQAVYTEFKKIINRSYSTPQLKKSVIQHLDKKLSQADAKKALAWYNSPIGKKISKLEATTSSSPERQAELENYAQELESHPADKKYVEKILQLSKAINAVESSVNTFLNIQLTIATAMESSWPNFSKEDLDTLNTQIQNMRPQITDKVTQSVLVFLLFTYKDLPLADLDEYIRFSKSTAGIQYNKSSNAALNQAFLKASKNFAGELARAKMH